LDVGLAVPMPRAVSLDFVDESPIFGDTCQWYKYVKIPGDGEKVLDKYVRRVSYKTSKSACTEEEFTTKYTFTLEQQSFDTLSDLVDRNIYKSFHWRYTKEILMMHWRTGRTVAVFGDDLMKEDANGQLRTVRQKQSDEEWVTIILEEFSMLDRSSVERAVKFTQLVKSRVDSSMFS